MEMIEAAAPTEPTETMLADLPAGAVVRQYQGAGTVANFGDRENELQAALRSCAAIHENWRVRLRVTGSDAARWLNGMLTNTSALDDGAGNYSFLLNAQGRLQGDAYMFRESADYVLETSAVQVQKIRDWLDHYIIMDDVELAAETKCAATIAIAGPNAPTLLSGFDSSLSDLPPLTLRESRIADVSVRIVLDDVCCIPCFHLWHSPAQSRELWNALTNAGAAKAGADAADFLRILSGVPLYGVDMGDRDLAQETSQSRALHFSKGCYLGQEIVERIRSRGQVHRGLRGFTAQAALPAGAEIMADDKAIGKLTSVATLPSANTHKFVGLGIVRLQPLDAGTPLQASGIALEPAAVPFLRKSDNSSTETIQA